MTKIKDKDKLQIPLKIDRIKDREIFDVLNVADNRSDFIKDALFYFVYHIEQGKVINRNYPYNKVNMRIDIKQEENEFIVVTNQSKQEDITIHNNNDYEEEYDDYEEDNFDDVDI